MISKFYGIDIAFTLIQLVSVDRLDRVHLLYGPITSKDAHGSHPSCQQMLRRKPLEYQP